MPITVTTAYPDHSNISLEFLTFPGGERHVKAGFIPYGRVVTIELIFKSSQDLIDLLLVNDAVRRQTSDKIHLLMKYVPFARQDRVAVKGEPHSLHVMAQLIKSCKFDSITVWDPHSDVVEALFADQDLVVIRQETLAFSTVTRGNLVRDRLVLVSPDAGALKKIYNINKVFHTKYPVICAEKMRDVATGKISGTKIDLSGQHTRSQYLIIDDLCDAGGTFLALAAEMRRQGATEIALYVTHGIFSKGLDVFKGLIDDIYCPNVLNDSVADKFIDGYYQVI